jgi:hypothetical protein
MEKKSFRLIQIRLAGRIMKTVRTNANNWILTEAAKRSKFNVVDIVQSIRDQDCEAQTVDDYSIDATHGHYDFDSRELVIY